MNLISQCKFEQDEQARSITSSDFKKNHKIPGHQGSCTCIAKYMHMTSIHKRHEFMCVLTIGFQEWYHNYIMRQDKLFIK